MIVVNGFWTGAIWGVLLALDVLFLISVHMSAKQARAKEKVIELIKQLEIAAKEKADESDNKEDSH